MKIPILLPSAIAVVLSNTGCKKDQLEYRPADPNTSVIPAIGNTAPVAYAGDDVFVPEPLDYAKLNGSASDAENNISTVKWAKISGPRSYTIERSGSVDTKVKDLEKGIYKFELTVTDSMNLIDKDTVVVTVGEISNTPTGTNEMIFKDLVWIFPWYNNVEIKNFTNNVPAGSSFKVFIQRDYDFTWKEVLPWDSPSLPADALYDCFVITGPHSMYNDGSLYISYYGSDVDDTPNVKIVY